MIYKENLKNKFYLNKLVRHVLNFGELVRIPICLYILVFGLSRGERLCCISIEITQKTSWMQLLHNDVGPTDQDTRRSMEPWAVIIIASTLITFLTVHLVLLLGVRKRRKSLISPTPFSNAYKRYCVPHRHHHHHLDLILLSWRSNEGIPVKI